MLKKIKTWLEKKQQVQKKKKELLNAQKYYRIIQQGGLFLKFIENDIAQMKKKQVNRHMRRRFEKSLNEFKLSEEIVQHYYQKMGTILAWINNQLNPAPKPKKKKEIDGAKFYDNLKKEEKKNAK